jgi:hypothetical protein
MVYLPGPLPKSPLTLPPEQEARRPSLSPCSTAPYAAVPRARLRLRAPHHPMWCHAAMARQVGGTAETVRQWPRRWQPTQGVRDAPRAGARRPCTPLPRAQITALACRAPRADGQAWRRGSGEKRAPVAVEPQIVPRLSPGMIRPWRRQDQSNPWRDHAWPHATDPPWVDKAVPGLDLYAHAQERAAQGEAVICHAEPTSSQARQRFRATTAAAPGWPVHGAAR